MWIFLSTAKIRDWNRESACDKMSADSLDMNFPMEFDRTEMAARRRHPQFVGDLRFAA